MSNNFINFPSLLDTSQVQNATFISNVFMMTLLTSLGFEGVRYYVEENSKKYLESDPQCGLTTGGRSECWWDCPTERVEWPGFPGVWSLYITSPSCLSDCYPQPDHCLNSLLADYKAAGGVCKGSSLDTNFPGLFPTSTQDCVLARDCDCPCTQEEIDNQVCTVDCCYYSNFFPDAVSTGLCSQQTRQLLVDQENCVHPLWSKHFRLTLNQIVYSMCDFETWYFFYPEPLVGRSKGKKRIENRRRNKKRNRFGTKKSLAKLRKRLENRLTPIETVTEIAPGLTISLVPPLENTRHRYPWLCSLRSVGKAPDFHYCGVTLLSRPPGPTVLVSSAHCTYLCKSREGNVVPNCCCPNVGTGSCTGSQQCGTSPEITEMTGDDAKVLCGEWDTNTSTEEEYNVVLKIKKIIRHPDYDISRGELNSQFVANDIAVFHVEDEGFESLSATHKIYPACLPSQQLTSTSGVHSGWAKPPPRDLVTSNVPLYQQVYKYFYQQWHYSMTIETCRDPVTEFFSGTSLQYPSNSYYPPGTLCATELNGNFCPTSGESGSPLVVKDQQDRFVMEGILSFSKGCSDFDFRAFGNSENFLNQLSENPSVYTRLSCYLPWVAEQYDMRYSPAGQPDPACLTGQGDINEVTAEVCRANIFGSNWEILDRVEAVCLFPFSVGGVSHDTCIMDEIEDFPRPVFRCPIRTVKGAGPAGTDYTAQHLTGGDLLDGSLCPTNVIGVLGVDDAGQIIYDWSPEGPVYGSNGELELDPDNDLCVGLYDGRRPVFSTCKNNCPGVNFPVVAGGFALLAASSLAGNVAGLGAIAPVLGAAGLAGTAGVAGMGLMMAMEECVGPLCVAASGQCCLLTMGARGIQCPDTC